MRNILNETNALVDSLANLEECKPLRICLLSYRSKPYCGGQGIYIKYLSSALAKLGHSVDIISGEPYPEVGENVRLIKKPGLNLFDRKNRFTALRLKDFRSATNLLEWLSVNSGGFPEPFTFGRRILKYLVDHMNEYDIIHDNQSLFPGLLKLQEMGIPIVATIHHPVTKDRDIFLESTANWWYRLRLRRWYYFLHRQRRVVSKLNHLLTVSHQSRQDIARDFNISESKIRVIYIGVDAEEFAPINGVVRQPRRLLATLSAEVPLKGLEFLLRAMARLIRCFPGLELLLIGSLNPGGHTDRLIDKLGLRRSVGFVSDLKTQEIVRYYAETTIAVSPSLYEGFGLPAAEAMACGVPVVATTAGGLPEVVGDAGVLVPPGNATALANAIADLLNDPGKRCRLGEAGRQRVLAKFSWDIAARMLTRYYIKLIKNDNH
jgi:glycosyltransferase involved in cell wall biosynthesis